MKNMLQLCQTTYLAKKAIKKNCIRSTKKREDSFIAVVPELWQCQTESIIAVEVSFFQETKILCTCKNKFMKKMNKESSLQFISVNSWKVLFHFGIQTNFLSDSWFLKRFINSWRASTAYNKKKLNQVLYKWSNITGLIFLMTQI